MMIPRSRSGPGDATVPIRPLAALFCQLWLIPAVPEFSLPEAVNASLPKGEVDKIRRYRVPAERALLYTARVAIRAIFARYFNTAMDAVDIVNDEHGRPRLLRKSALPLDFNYSHSGAAVAVLLVSHGRAGVDIECAPHAKGLEQAMAYVCTEEEQTAIAALPRSERRNRLLSYWVLKEAYLKAVGVGFAGDPKTISLRIDSDHVTARGADPAKWRFQIIDDDDYRIGVATLDNCAPLLCERVSLLDLVPL